MVLPLRIALGHGEHSLVRADKHQSAMRRVRLLEKRGRHEFVVGAARAVRTTPGRAGPATLHRTRRTLGFAIQLSASPGGPWWQMTRSVVRQTNVGSLQADYATMVWKRSKRLRARTRAPPAPSRTNRTGTFPNGGNCHYIRLARRLGRLNSPGPASIRNRPAASSQSQSGSCRYVP